MESSDSRGACKPEASRGAETRVLAGGRVASGEWVGEEVFVIINLAD